MNGGETRQGRPPNQRPAPLPAIRRDWTCLASALLITLLLCTVLAIGSIWLYTLSHRPM